MPGKSVTIKEDTAEVLSSLLIRQSAELNAFLASLEREVGDTEFDAVRDMIGHILGETYVVALYPIFEQFPGLKPAGFP